MSGQRESRDMNALPDETFRAEVRAWIEANYPPAKRYLPRRPLPPEIMDWFMALSRKGWLAPVWPLEHGGMGLSAAKHLIYVEEMDRHGCARLPERRHALHHGQGEQVGQARRTHTAQVHDAAVIGVQEAVGVQG